MFFQQLVYLGDVGEFAEEFADELASVELFANADDFDEFQFELGSFDAGVLVVDSQGFQLVRVEVHDEYSKQLVEVLRSFGLGDFMDGVHGAADGAFGTD